MPARAPWPTALILLIGTAATAQETTNDPVLARPKPRLSLNFEYPRDISTCYGFDLRITVKKGSREFTRKCTAHRTFAGPHGADQKNPRYGAHRVSREAPQTECAA